MVSCARRETVDPHQVATYHLVSRCVRRTRLLGHDPVSGKNYNHRKRWIEVITALLVESFAIDLISFAVLDNHIHHLLRSRPDLAAGWSDREVARRWLRIYPDRKKAKKKVRQGEVVDPGDKEITALIRDKKRIARLRRRLSDISWLMGRLKEQIARRANAEDEVTGRFWDGRFHCTRLESEASIIACSTYVDLNVIRAGVAHTPEDSLNTSIYYRLIARQSRARRRNRSDVNCSRKLPDDPQADRYLAPIFANILGEDECFAKSGFRPSDDSAFGISIDQYLHLLEWTGRQLRVDKAGSIPADLAPIHDRLGINSSSWVGAIDEFESWTGRVVGSGRQMAAAAQRVGRQWFHGIRRAREVFDDPPQQQ